MSKELLQSPAPLVTCHKAPMSSPIQVMSAAFLFLSLQEYKVMTEIMLLQKAAANYKLGPEKQFGAWFWDMERLSENER